MFFNNFSYLHQLFSFNFIVFSHNSSLLFIVFCGINMDNADTGGLLNLLNGKAGISAPVNSVPVNKLINIHKPRSYEELESLINYHYYENCSCGVKSTGTVKDFGCRLYEAQLEFFGDYLFSLEECIRWEYDLFVKNSLKGNLMENKAVSCLRKLLPKCIVCNSEGFVDEFYRVDVEIFFNDILVCGIQVKPFSYVFMEKEVKFMNDKGNSKYESVVFYLFYDDDGFFMNLDIVVADVQELI